MSLCDKCWSPGACCKGFVLSGVDHQETTFWLDEDVNAQIAAHGFPFELSSITKEYKDDETGRPYGTIVVSCPKLDADGRCSIYEDRPALCRDFEPRHSPLCVHFHLESGDASAEFGFL